MKIVSSIEPVVPNPHDNIQLKIYD